MFSVKICLEANLYLYLHCRFSVQTEVVVSRCRENINLLEAALAGGSLSSALQRDVRGKSIIG